jgi:hypothetical protein
MWEIEIRFLFSSLREPGIPSWLQLSRDHDWLSELSDGIILECILVVMQSDTKVGCKVRVPVVAGGDAVYFRVFLRSDRRSLWDGEG